MQTLHINLVSNYLVPNLIPALTPALGCRAAVLVLGDSNMEDRAERLRQIYEDHGIPVLDILRCGSSTHYPTLIAAAESLADRLEQTHPDLFKVLNATGGTKPMAFAFVEAFSPTENRGVIYTDTQNKQLQFLSRKGVEVPQQSVLDLSTYLISVDFEPEHDDFEEQTNEVVERRDLTMWLANRLCGHQRSLVPRLNGLSSQATKDLQKLGLAGFHATQQSDHPPRGEWASIYERLMSEGLWYWDHDLTVTFRDPEAARYIQGGWLEEYAYLCAKDAGIDHVGLNVKGRWLTDSQNRWLGEATNEFDLLLLHHNQLLLLECKSGTWTKAGSSQQVVNKLEALTRKLFGGQFGGGMLLSVNDMPDSAIDRIAAYRLELLEGRQLHNLTERLKQWAELVTPLKD